MTFLVIIVMDMLPSDMLRLAKPPSPPLNAPGTQL